MSYAKEKLELAIRNSFTIGEGDSRERLADGFIYYLFTLNENHFTEKHWKRFKKIRDNLTKNGPLIILDKIVIGAFENGKKSIRKKTASNMIKELISIYEEI